MAQHYGVINQISDRRPARADRGAEAALVEQYGDALDGAEVLGGHQFLERYPEFSPFSLAMLFSNASVGRLGPGTYAGQVTIDGTTVIILNGFHPRQLSFFTADDTVCAFLHGSSDTDWETLRSELIGATDPAKAAAIVDPRHAQGRPGRVRTDRGELQLQRRPHVRRPARGPGRTRPVLRRPQGWRRLEVRRATWPRPAPTRPGSPNSATTR